MLIYYQIVFSVRYYVPLWKFILSLTFCVYNKYGNVVAVLRYQTQCIIIIIVIDKFNLINVIIFMIWYLRNVTFHTQCSRRKGEITSLYKYIKLYFITELLPVIKFIRYNTIGVLTWTSYTDYTYCYVIEIPVSF